MREADGDVHPARDRGAAECSPRVVVRSHPRSSLYGVVRRRSPQTAGLYGYSVMVQRHWWNGSSTARARRDVFIPSDGLQWDVLVQIGGTAGRYRVRECPSASSAVIIADAWRGSSVDWRELAPPFHGGVTLPAC